MLTPRIRVSTGWIITSYELKQSLRDLSFICKLFNLSLITEQNHFKDFFWKPNDLFLKLSIIFPSTRHSTLQTKKLLSPLCSQAYWSQSHPLSPVIHPGSYMVINEEGFFQLSWQCISKICFLNLIAKLYHFSSTILFTVFSQIWLLPNVKKGISVLLAPDLPSPPCLSIHGGIHSSILTLTVPNMVDYTLYLTLSFPSSKAYRAVHINTHQRWRNIWTLRDTFNTSPCLLNKDGETLLPAFSTKMEKHFSLPSQQRYQTYPELSVATLVMFQEPILCAILCYPVIPNSQSFVWGDKNVNFNLILGFSI